MNKKSFLISKTILLLLITQSNMSVCMNNHYSSKEEKITAKIEKRNKQKAEKTKQEKAEEKKIDKAVVATEEQIIIVKEEQIVIEEKKDTTEEQQQINTVEENAPITINNSLKKSRLMEARIITPTPSKRIYPYSAFSFGKERDHLLADLESNAFDLDNMEYHIILNRSIGDFIDNNEHEKLTKIFKLIQEKYCGKIKPEDIQTRRAHEYLTTTHKEKLDLLKNKSTELNKERLIKLNGLLITMQKEFMAYAANTKEIIDAYSKEISEKVSTSGNDIRESKEALLRIHQLNRTFRLKEDGYCSDEENHPLLTGHKALKDPEFVSTFYGDVYILNKIGVDQKCENTIKKIKSRLDAFSSINKQIQEDMPLLTYIDDKNNNHSFNVKK